tara:strand:+ start:235 stop:567 length:333 start_codon:yes stop_codon:yes gene_type:complete
MEYNELNLMLSGLELTEPKISSKKVEDEAEVIKQKTEANDLLCFRDMIHRKNASLKNDIFSEKPEVSSDMVKKINDDLKNRMFDLNNDDKPKPIMEFYPRSSRNINKNKD